MSPEDTLALLLDIGFSIEDWKKPKSVTDKHLNPANTSIFLNYRKSTKKLVDEKKELTSTVMSLPIETVGG